MTRDSLGSRLGIIALLGAFPTACADDIANPFETANETETEGDDTTAGIPTTGDDDDDDDDDDVTTSSTGGTTMAVDDTGTTTMGDDDDDDSTSDSTTTGTTGDETTDSGSSDSSSEADTANENHVPCPADVIPNDMGLPVSVNGDSSLQNSDFGGSCGGGGAPDYTFEFTAPEDGDYIFDTFQSTFDTVLYVLDGLCMGEEMTCDDDGLTGTNQSLASVSLLQDQTVTVVVDAFGLSGGGITLTVREGSVACPVEEIDTVPTVETGQTVVATDEFFGSCGAGNAPDQGYLFTAPQDGTYTFEITNNDFDTVLYLLDDSCGGAELACNDNLPGGSFGASGLTYPLSMGQQVTVVVDGFFEDFGNFDLNIGVLEGDCPDEDLGAMVPPFTVTGGSTAMEDNASAGTCGGLAAADWTYTWTAPADGTYRFGTENTEYDTVIYVQDGNDCLGPELACNNDTPLGTDAVTNAFVAQDQTVTITVDGNGAEGAYDLFVGVDCPAQDLGSTVPQTITDTNGVASDVFNASCGSGGSPEEVYTFTAPEDGTYIFETLNNDFDTILFVLDAICSGNELACNDNSGGPSGESGLAIGLTAGQTVSIGVEGFFGAVGTYDLSISQLDGSCPDEDLGDTGVPFMTSGDTSMADNGAGGSCGGLGDVDYSYTWTAPFDGTFMFSTEGSAFDTVVYVHDGPTCGGIELGCNDDFDFANTYSSAIVPLLSGQVVTVTVDGNDGGSGAYDLSIDETSDCCFSHPYTGCDDAVVEACVCALDSFCCNTSWDGLCVNGAINNCMADC